MSPGRGTDETPEPREVRYVAKVSSLEGWSQDWLSVHAALPRIASLLKLVQA